MNWLDKKSFFPGSKERLFANRCGRPACGFVRLCFICAIFFSLQSSQQFLVELAQENKNSSLVILRQKIERQEYKSWYYMGSFHSSLVWLGLL